MASQGYPSITCTTTSPEKLKMRVDLPDEGNNRKTKLDNTKRSVDDILSAHWSLQPPRLQTRVYSPHDLQNAVFVALSYDGSALGIRCGPQTPTFLPFSGNFILDKLFTLPKQPCTVLEKVRMLDSTQKAECAAIAQKLVEIVEEVDGFSYVKQGTGSPLQGSKTVTGWYFHYVCEASRERLPKKKDRCDCKGSIYVSISPDRIYIYYTHRDVHAPTTPRPTLKLEKIAEAPLDIPPSITSPRPLPTPPPRKHPARTNPTPLPASPPSTSPIVSPFSVNGSSIIVCPALLPLPKVRPTPVSVPGAVNRNYTKLRALSDLVETWDPEDDAEGQEKDAGENPFLKPIFGFMAEWFQGAMEYPGVQREIYRVLDLQKHTGVEEFLRENQLTPRMEKGVGEFDVRKRHSMDTDLSDESDITWRQGMPELDMVGLGYGSGYGGFSGEGLETPVREKRKSEDMSGVAFTFGGRKKKTRTGI